MSKIKKIKTERESAKKIILVSILLSQISDYINENWKIKSKKGEGANIIGSRRTLHFEYISKEQIKLTKANKERWDKRRKLFKL